MRYIVQKGDTLSTIAKNTTGDYKNYLVIASTNDIQNPDKITTGQTLEIPEKFNKPLKKSEIPTKNKIQVIDNYSPNYNYIVEGNKVYYARKGKDYWVDISDNKKAQLNLLKFLNDKYNFKGYDDKEKELYNQLNNPKPQLIEKFPIIKIQKNYTVPNDNTFTYINKYSNNTKKSENPSEYSISTLWKKGKNWITRQLEKNNISKESDVTEVKPIILEGDYKLRSNFSTTGDTIKIQSDPRRYFIPENLVLNNFTFGTRNRGDYTPIDSEAASITTFDKFLPFNKIKGTSGQTYIGIDSKGNFKAGDYSIFQDGDMMSRTFSNKVISFKKDKDGKTSYKNDAKHGNRNRGVPIVLVQQDDGTIKEGALNILSTHINSPKEQKGSTFGNISGGRLVAQVGNKYLLLSGSIDKIEQDIENLKKEYKVPYVTVYTLDNGSYNRGLRTYDKRFTESDLKKYDAQNNGGGNFMYISKNKQVPKFSSDTIFTPNIRTADSESYKKGHPLINEKKGIVLHHTGFQDANLNPVLKYLTDPKTEASAHVVIGYNGERKVLANPDQVAFHAGASRFNNRNNVNDFMLGIEFQGNTNVKDLTDEQIESAVEYLIPIIYKYKIPLQNIVTHEQIRNAYNDYAIKSGKQSADKKIDINAANYNKIIQKLLEKVYYKF